MPMWAIGLACFFGVCFSITMALFWYLLGGNDRVAAWRAGVTRSWEVRRTLPVRLALMKERLNSGKRTRTDPAPRNAPRAARRHHGEHGQSAS